MVRGGGTGGIAGGIQGHDRVEEGIVGVGKDNTFGTVVVKALARQTVDMAVAASGLVVRVGGTDVPLVLACGAVGLADGCIGPFEVVVAADRALEVGGACAL